MKVQLGWLRELVDLPEPAAEVGRVLTSLGFALDGLEGDGEAAVLELDVGSNRPDALCHVGLARELAVSLARELRMPASAPVEVGDAASSTTSVTVEAPDLCPRYAARVVKGVKVGPSPPWMAARLEACGIRPINVIVDVTNYVLLELGHPLHAFDLDLLAEKRIVVRRVRPGERLATLDGAERQLAPDMLLIADVRSGVAVAGVMGGAHSEIRDTTRDVLLESAVFQPASIRRTSKALKLHTEASHRFERGSDWDVVPIALDRAAKLLAELGGGQVLAGRLDVAAAPPAPPEILLRRARLRLLTGTDIPDATVERVLAGLGMTLLASVPEGWRTRPPRRRADVTREADLIEEVLRHHGFDRVEPTLPAFREGARPRTPWEDGIAALRRAAVSSGHLQAVSFTFGADADMEAWGSSVVDGGASRRIPLENPIAENLATLRTSLVPGLLLALGHAVRHGEHDARLFEEGTAFFRHAEGTRVRATPVEERPVFALAQTGRRGPTHYLHRPAAVDLAALEGAVLEALAAAHGRADAFAVVPGAAPHAAPGASASVVRRADGVRVGWLARLHPEVAARHEITAPVFLAEVDLTGVLPTAAPAKQFAPLSRFPRVVRDASVVLPANLAYRDIEAALDAFAAQAGSLVESFELVDRYSGKGVPDGSVSLSFSVSYRSPERTLTQAEVDAAHAALVSVLATRFGATLRA